MYPYITGRLLVQTTPAAAYDREGTIAHAKRLVALFEAQGVPKYVPRDHDRADLPAHR